MPLVSVVIPNYNHERFLERRIRSILDQTLQDFEIILLDDASTDGSQKIINRYREDPRFRIVINDQNSGSVCRQWNLGVSFATAPYVWIAEADDIAEPGLLRALVERLEARPATVLAYAQSWFIDEHDQRQGDLYDWTADLHPDRWRSDFGANGREECANYLILKNTIPNASAVVFRREAFLRAGAAYEGLRLCGDWMTWSRLLLQGDVAFVAEHLNQFRRHTGSVRASTGLYQSLAESLKVSQFIMDEVPLTRRARVRARAAFRAEWWATIRYHLSPKWASLIETARCASHLGTWTQLWMIFAIPAARLAKAGFMEPLLIAKRRAKAWLKLAFAV